MADKILTSVKTDDKPRAELSFEERTEAALQLLLEKAGLTHAHADHIAALAEAKAQDAPKAAENSGDKSDFS